MEFSYQMFKKYLTDIIIIYYAYIFIKVLDEIFRPFDLNTVFPFENFSRTFMRN